MSTEANMSGRVKSVINRCRKGERLYKSQGPKTVGGYFFEPSGHAAGEKSAKQAIASGGLIGLNDGMFGESQTWVARDTLL
jgi:hypothetical protein